MKTKSLRSMAALLGLAVLATAHAATVPLTNPSFESPVVGAWSSGFLPDGWSWDYGNYIQSPAAHHGSQGVVNLGRSGFFRVSQQSTYKVVRAGEETTGKVWVRVTNMESGVSDFELVILIGGVPVITNTFVVTTNMLSGQSIDWTNISVKYLTTAADIGQTVGVAIGNDGGNSETYTPSYCYMDEVSLDTATTGGPTAIGTASPNPVDLYSNVLFSVTVTPGLNPTISSVVLDASAIGGPADLSLISAGGNAYTNTVAASAPTALDSVVPVPAKVTDASGLVGEAPMTLTVRRPALMTWAGGTGNWTDSNWLPYNLSGPAAGQTTAIVTNGQILANTDVGGVGTIIVGPSGVLQFHNTHFNGPGNILLTGGTLDTYDSSYYHAYGASILPRITAAGNATSTIANSGDSWFNLADPASTFAVSNGATLNVSARLAGAVAANDNFFNPTALTKVGAGTLVLSGTNFYSGGTTVAEGSLTLASVNALATNSGLTVAKGAKANLDYSGTMLLGTLVLDGITQPGGTHGATGSGASYINDTYFTGRGVISAQAPLSLVLFYKVGSGWELSWPTGFILQTNSNLADPAAWGDLPGATSPLLINPASNARLFYKLRPVNVAFEGESASTLIPGSPQSWAVASITGASGGKALQSQGTVDTATSPHSFAQYQVTFTSPGTYYMYYRWTEDTTSSGDAINSNSFWVRNGWGAFSTAGEQAGYIRSDSNNYTSVLPAFRWQQEPSLTFTVTAAEVTTPPTLTIGTREPGMSVDRVVLSTVTGLSSASLDAIPNTQ